jgi:hypothetical protein
LGLAKDHRFWTDPPGVLTQTRLWSEAVPIPRDKAMTEGDTLKPKKSIR